LIAGPLLPEGLEQTPLAALVAGQTAIRVQAAELWANRPLARLAQHAGEPDLAALEAIGTELAGAAAAEGRPIAETWQGQPAVAIELPGLPKNALQLTLSGDELIVRIGAYRRHMLLPERLRGGAIKATREGEYLIVRRRA
jgi:hypothetical protein